MWFLFTVDPWWTRCSVVSSIWRPGCGRPCPRECARWVAEQALDYESDRDVGRQQGSWGRVAIA